MRKPIGKVIVAAFCLAVVWLVTAPAAYADDWDKATRITVNQPFEVPGKVLPAGTYVVKIVDLAGERHVVRFFNADETIVYATLIGIPDFRLEPTEKTAMTFYEADVGRAKALHSWFYPGHQYGIEFAYPKGRAAEIATAAAEPVIAYNEPEIVAAEEPSPPALLEEPLVAVTPGGEEVAIAELFPEFIPTPEPELDWEAFVKELPRTATPFPLVALIGLGAAAAAGAVRFFGK